MCKKYFFWGLFFCVVGLFAQSKKTTSIKILHAKKLTDGRGENYQKLVGNVGLQSGETQLFCDSAEINQLTNDFWAWGNVYIVKSSEVKAFGDSAFYQGASGNGSLVGEKVKVIKEGLELYTKILYFNDKVNLMYYLNWGEIITDSTTIVSKKGYYHSDSEVLDLFEKVHITNPDYEVWADTAFLKTKQDISIFKGFTYIHTSDQKIFCKHAYHHNQQKIFHFVHQACIESKENTLYADSIFVNEQEELSWAFENVHLEDTLNNVDIYGHLAFFNQKDSSSYVTDSTMFSQLIDQDTLWVSCDTLRAVEKNNQKEFYAYYGVKMFKKDLQGFCDSLSYTLTDSMMSMYGKPVLWNEESQMTADTIKMAIVDNQIKQLFLFNNSFIISEVEVEEEFYDQIKGKNMVADFKDGKIDMMHVMGNGQTMYYAAEEDDSTYTGVNKAICSNMKIKFKDNRIAKIIFLVQPEATFYPLDDLEDKEKKMDDFKWLEADRPKSIQDILPHRKKQKHT